jgi:hypothetical protein
MPEMSLRALREIIRAEIHATADEGRQLKRWWRTPDDERPEPPATRFALHPTRKRATLLCMVMAHSRGRRHRKGCADLAEQEAELVTELAAMDRMVVQTPLLDAGVRAIARAILGVRSATACVAPTEERRA